MQLVAYGAQDIYLTGNPQITFFKVVYRRHTNFSMETIQQTINGTSTLSGSSSTGTVTISRNGDLVSDVYVSSNTTGIHHGDEIIQEVELEIGGQRIDRHTKEWLQIWEELTTPASKTDALKVMKKADSRGDAGLSIIPLQFWFCRNPGLSLPLIALQYHEVKLKFTFGTSAYASVGVAAAVQVWCDYIYLDTDERRRFAQVSHEYLIEQLQFDNKSSATNIKLNFNHPVKELIWTSAVTNVYGDAKLTLNGHDRFSAQEEEYFQLRQPIKYHTHVPKQNLAHSAVMALSVNMPCFGGSLAVPRKFEAMNRADSVVTTNSVMVSKGGNNTLEDISGVTTADTANEVTSASVLVYSFKTSDLQNHGALPAIGDIFDFEVSGTNSVSNGTNRSHVVARVTGISNGAIGGISDTGNYHIQLNNTLCEATLDDEIVNAADFTIHSIKEVSRAYAATSNMRKRINVYSFALKPEEHQPSGTCNFSRIDNASLIFTTANGESFTVYAVNYNVLRIMSGMGGLAYSN